MTALATPPDSTVQPATPVLPTIRLAGVIQAVAGGMLLGLAGRRGGRMGHGLRAIGAGLLASALAEPAQRAVLRVGSKRHAAEVETSFTVEQPIREVFGFFSNLERLLPLLPQVESIADHQDGRTDWRLRGVGVRPALEWRALVSKYVPGQVIAWESVPGEPVQSSGLVRFSAPSANTTLVSLSITFLPREVEMDEAWRSLFSRTMEHQLRDALADTPHRLEEWARGKEDEPPAD